MRVKSDTMNPDSTINQLGNVLTYIIISVIVVAIIGVVVSRKSQTSALMQSFGSAFDGALSIAEAPITNNQGSAATGAGATGGTTNNTVIGSQLALPLLPSDPIGAGVTSAGFTNFLTANGIQQGQLMTVELPGIGQTQTGSFNFTTP
jgi:hypothetical protein